MADPSKQSSKLKVFISYSRDDLAIADEIANALERHGFDVLIDRRDLPYGEKWQAELADFIIGSDTVIWVISPASVASKWCRWELDQVGRHNKRLIPVKVGDVKLEDLPPQLSEIHILPAEGQFSIAEHLPILVTTLETDRAWVKEQSRLNDRARQWHSKNRAPGLLLHGRALADAEKWQDARPATAPAPGADILEYILASRRSATKRQRRLVGSLAAGFILALGLAGIAVWQWDQAQKQAARVIRVTSLSGWQAFQKPNEVCLRMRKFTGEEGLRALYCRVRDSVNYRRIEQLAGMPVFVSGPHKDYKLYVRENDFGHYNPEFLVWAQKNLLPRKNDALYIATTKPLYDKFMRRMSHAYHRTYVQWSRNLDHFEKERRYLVDMIAGKRPWSYLGARWQVDSLKTILDLDVERENLNEHHVATALRFWQRRSIDGTADEFFAALEAMLAIYDPDFLASAPRPAGSAPHLPRPGAIPEPRSDPKRPWLPEPTGPNMFLNDVVVIE